MEKNAMLRGRQYFKFFNIFFTFKVCKCRILIISYIIKELFLTTETGALLRYLSFHLYYDIFL